MIPNIHVEPSSIHRRHVNSSSAEYEDIPWVIRTQDNPPSNCIAFYEFSVRDFRTQTAKSVIVWRSSSCKRNESLDNSQNIRHIDKARELYYRQLGINQAVGECFGYDLQNSRIEENEKHYQDEPGTDLDDDPCLKRSKSIDIIKRCGICFCMSRRPRFHRPSTTVHGFTEDSIIQL